jgi:hypothetical protein
MDATQRPPRFEEALDLYRQGHAALAAGDQAGELSQRRQEAYVHAAALFAGAQAAAALRLITPVHITAGGGQ